MRRLALGPEVDVWAAVWACPTSGWGVCADEQPLPYLVGPEAELTPRYGGEAGWDGTDVASLPLPGGQLDQAWPWVQRMFNLPRRRINIHWRQIFTSRCRPDGWFHVAEQLRFVEIADGFRGRSPVLDFTRTFATVRGGFEVHDRIGFARPLAFREFRPVVLATFAEDAVWAAGEPVPRARLSVETIGFRLDPVGPQSSATGPGQLWAERMYAVRFAAGDAIERRYRYHIAEVTRG